MRRLLIGIAAIAAFFACAVAVLKHHAGEGVSSERPLDELTRDELYEIARELDIPGRSRMKKTDLRAALSRAGRSG
jgi:hypothetical protein